MEKIGIIGTGLIGGSFGLALQKTGRRIYAADKNPEHLREALSRGLAHDVLTDDNLRQMDGLILAVPVDKLPGLAWEMLDKTASHTWIFDTGSIKSNIARAVASHPQRKRFILSHPIAGTEYSGPQAAVENLFEGKMNIICDPDDSDPGMLQRVVDLHAELGMTTRFLASDEHDRHIAYVSHLSHVSSFLLGKTVMDVEKSEENIYLMAGSGFASTVRLAKSSPDTWTPIFMENKQYLLEVLSRYMENLKNFATLLERGDADQIHRWLTEINRIGRVIDRIKHDGR